MRGQQRDRLRPLQLCASRGAHAKVHTLTSTPQIGSLDCTSQSFCTALASPKANPSVNTGYITQTDVAGIAFTGNSLVLLSLNGDKAVISAGAPPKMVALVGLSKAAKVS